MAMDQQLIQQLTQVFQQGLQILQQAGGMGNGMGNPDEDADEDGTPDEMSEDEDYGMEEDDEEDDDGADMDKDMGGSLHDRIKTLERHTGLKKSASNLPLLHRIDSLETHWLGTEYEGTPMQRVQQLENVVLGKSASRSAAEDAPDVIPLDDLIKSAVQQGIRQGLKQAKQNGSDLPAVGEMRKSAQQTYGNRKARSPKVQSDEDLVKSAQAWGYDEADLDQPVGLGDVLMAQYFTSQNGSNLPIEQ